MLVEADRRRILLDTGQSEALERNVAALGVDLAKIQALVLSHGHYDHTGALPFVLCKAPDVEIYCHPGILQTRYAIRDGKAKPIGIPEPALKALQSRPPERVHEVAGAVMLSERIGVVSAIPRHAAYEDTGGPFYLDPQGLVPDLIEDDLALWIRSQTGVVVCLGCAHAGPINTLQHIRGLTQGARIRAVVGGFHLMDASRERVDRTIDALLDLAPDLVVPCHCTGKSNFGPFRESFGERMREGAAGMVLQF
ncbi:MAG: MBL fold metallo-hydrolase [Thermoleophilia bacterium]|nr:MBL fold metallo-hydrolase [Thermoleophilia bacterium]